MNKASYMQNMETDLLPMNFFLHHQCRVVVVYFVLPRYKSLGTSVASFTFCYVRSKRPGLGVGSPSARCSVVFAVFIKASVLNSCEGFWRIWSITF